MINAAAGQQVTPAGAAIKLHFACNNNNNNNNNNNSKNSSINYSGLKTMEHKMSNNNNNNINNNINNRWQKVELIRRQASGEAAALATSAPPMPPQPMGFYKPTLSEDSEDHLPVNSVAAAAAPPPATSGEEPPSRRVACRGSGSILWGFDDGIIPFRVSAYSSANAFQGAFQGITAATKRLSPGVAGVGAGPAKVTATATSLRWLSMPVSREKPSLAKAAASSIAAGQPKSPLGAAARSALINPQPQPQPQRTEDQENAFRRIEDVHNYAKLQDGSSDDADDDDDDDVDEEEEEEEEQGEEEEEDEEEGIQVQLPVQQVVTRIRREDTEEHVDVDVVTVPPPEQEHQSQQGQQQQQLQQDQASADSIRPEHHARRPMNAFLIFCKRHRAIVKERYKTLENRAITKILGDWWAALDEKEKQCFTDLAQQNKDAFFNANPNFKWYKLPAPPLRTLATRPSNAATGAGVLPSSEDQQAQQLAPPPPTSAQQLQLQWTGAERSASGVPLALLRRNYFKLADETQMGDLSSLLQVQVPEKDYALQQVLSETSQFLSAHMPPAGRGGKRSLPDSNSSNSSEEEAAAAAAAAGLSSSKKAKSSRSCKGKIYQELVNSGQLSAIAKSKSKTLRSPSAANLMMLAGGGCGGGNFADISLDAAPNTPPVSPPERHNDTNSPVHLRSVSESSSSGFFDLEEKIKELPALSLDAYLQRKRSTKKKKKFSGSKKQRNSNSTSGVGVGASAATASVPAPGKVAASMAGTSDHLVRIKQQQQQQQAAAAAAVGSQRRKARKESITRRDVSAIEQEVASILPLTINGCYYFDQSDAPRALSHSVNGNATSLSASPSSSSSSSPPLSSNSSSSSSSLSLSSPAAYDVMTSSTSDLLILAEVAANRTELNSKSN
ncbi:hypothetical protein KR032_001722 [Drosophila birchii]|nr:hypothetical protein KR032_001722 [Drosophila birchii]